MFCENCGNEIQEGALFCDKCGNKFAVSPVEVVQQENKTVQQGKTAESENKADMKKKPAKKHTLLSIVIVILIVILGTCMSAAYSVRNATNEKAIDKLTRELDFSEIKVGFLDGKGKDMTLAKYISENTASDYKRYFTNENIEKLLKEKFVRKFAADKLNDYFDDVFNDTGDGVFEKDEFNDLLNDNMDDIYDALGLYMDEGMVDSLSDDMDKEGFFDNTDLSEIRDDNPMAFGLVKNLLSYWMMALTGIIIAVLMVCIILIQDRKIRAVGYIGTSLLLVGLVNIVLSFMNGTIVDSLNHVLALGRKFWQQVLAPMGQTWITVGCILTVTGIIMLVVDMVIKASARKRTEENIA